MEYIKEGSTAVRAGITLSFCSKNTAASETDAVGHPSSHPFTIKVQDTTAPTLSAIANQTDEATSAAGAAASFVATATDIVDGTDRVVFTEGNAVVHSGDTFAIGSHTITASATDAHGNTSSESFT